jgi:CheY-like chemotaxis protein
MNMPKSDHRVVVLAVEDEPIVRMSMADFLDDAGFKVFEAVNADEAIALLQARSDVHVVVTDIEMPGSMNGIELARVVRVRWPGVGIVMTSGRVRPQTGDLMGGVVFLSKPYLPDAVIGAIRQVIMPKRSI